MGLTLKGVNVKGVQILGSEFLEPTQIPNCVSWLKWQTGVTSSAGKFFSWADQVPGWALARSDDLVAAKRPNYDTLTGKVQGDGVDDFFWRINTRDDVAQEYWFVIGPTVDNTNNPFLFSWLRATAPDGDVIAYRSWNGALQQTVAGGTGNVTRTVTSYDYLGGPTYKFICSFRGQTGKPTYQITANNIEHGYTVRNSMTYLAGGSVPDRKQYFISSGGNVLATPGYPTMNVSSCGDMPFYEFAQFSRLLNSLERLKLSNYFKQKHLII